MKRLVCLLSLLVLTGCTTARSIDEHVRVDLSAKTVIYRDQWVHRAPPEVHVQPTGQAGNAPKVLFIPFRVTQAMANPSILGYSTARIVWQTWLTMQLFPAMEFSGDDTPYRRDRAVELGRMRGADMVVGGFVTYAYAGGSAGDSQISIQIEAHDTRSGQLVWSMAQSGLMPATRTTDFFLFASQTRVPSDPMHAITQALASDMGRVIQTWTAGPAAPLTDIQELDKKVHGAVFGPSDPVPAPRTSEQAPVPDKGAF